MSAVQCKSSSQKQLTQKDYQEFCPPSRAWLIGLGCYCLVGNRLELFAAVWDFTLVFLSFPRTVSLLEQSVSLCTSHALFIYLFLLISPPHLVLRVSSRLNPEGFTFSLSAHEMNKDLECIASPCERPFRQLVWCAAYTKHDVWYRLQNDKSVRACSFWLSYMVRTEQF